MAPLSPKLTELARRIVDQQAGESRDPAASAAAVEAACGKLTGHLVDLLGSGGVSALRRRALHLAQLDSRLLADVTVNVEPTGCFARLTESLSASSDEDARAAATSILSYVIYLLIMMLGEDLGMKPIRKLWPQATSAREIDE